MPDYPLSSLTPGGPNHYFANKGDKGDKGDKYDKGEKGDNGDKGHKDDKCDKGGKGGSKYLKTSTLTALRLIWWSS